MPSDLDRLRELAADLAREWSEAVLLILDPPPMDEWSRHLPYCCLTTQATAAERGAAVESVAPPPGGS